MNNCRYFDIDHGLRAWLSHVQLEIGRLRKWPVSVTTPFMSLKKEMYLHFLFVFQLYAMYRKKPDVDIILDVLEAVLKRQPDSVFVRSLWHQYQERGGLSKKQLEGLYGKAQKVKDLPAGKLATLEAVIMKRPTRYKSVPPPPKPLYEKDERVGEMIGEILAKYPQHKRVLYFRSKYDNNEALTAAEVAELEKFRKVLK